MAVGSALTTGGASGGAGASSGGGGGAAAGGMSIPGMSMLLEMIYGKKSNIPIPNLKRIPGKLTNPSISATGPVGGSNDQDFSELLKLLGSM